MSSCLGGRYMCNRCIIHDHASKKYFPPFLGHFVIQNELKLGKIVPASLLDPIFN